MVSSPEARAQLPVLVMIASGPSTATSQFVGGTSHGWSGDAALWLSVPKFPLGLRLDASMSRFAERRYPELCGTYQPGMDCGTNSSRDAIDAGTLSLTYTLHWHRLSPYALAGAGVYRVGYTRHFYPCDPSASCVSQPNPYTQRTQTTRFGTSAGLGLALRLGRADLTAEARYHAYSHYFGRGHMVPITFGVRL